LTTRRKNDDGARVLESDEGQEVAPGTAIATHTEGLSTFTVSLPAAVHETPEDEVALLIDDIAITPYLDATSPTTTSITVIQSTSLTVPEPGDTGPVIPALPESDDVHNRRPRPRGDLAQNADPASLSIDQSFVVGKKKRRSKVPEGWLQRLLYEVTFHLVHVGDSYRVRQRKALEARIGKPFHDGTRFVAVLTRKGGVGKTTVSVLLGMAMADVREDRVIAIDANPDRGTLAERVTKTTRATVRDAVAKGALITEFAEFQTLISRDETGLDVLASDPAPTVSRSFGEVDYGRVAEVAGRFYAVAIVDCGTGVTHSAAKASLQQADSVVIVSGGSVEEARVASETLTWLESNGYAQLAENSVLALNTATHGTNLFKIEEIEAHFKPRVRDIVRIPYDPALASGSVIHYRNLKPMTRDAARELAALVGDGLAERRIA
jgi:MinD-like ATPase involved in chromosome partitioning or flagellar assembly